MKETFTVKEETLKDVADKIVRSLASVPTGKAKILFLDGELGAGKTTFTKAIAEILGITRDAVHSPTFILKKEYPTESSLFKKLIHIDAYRFDDPQEAGVLKLSRDYENHENLIVIEWPSKLGEHVKEDMSVFFSVIDDDTRKLMVHYTRPNTGVPEGSVASTFFRV